MADYNRLKDANPELTARVLVVSASADVGAQYVPTMNCIFSANKEGVPIDTLVCSDVESSFLQQAAHSTGGLYYAPPLAMHGALLQVLLTYYLPDAESRPFLLQPPQVRAFPLTCAMDSVRVLLPWPHWNVWDELSHCPAGATGCRALLISVRHASATRNTSTWRTSAQYALQSSAIRSQSVPCVGRSARRLVGPGAAQDRLVPVPVVVSPLRPPQQLDCL